MLFLKSMSHDIPDNEEILLEEIGKLEEALDNMDVLPEEAEALAHIPDSQPPNPKPQMPAPDAHIIVFGNEKGGSGKSTSAMHVTIGLLKMGYKVGSIDLDARQGSYTRYLTNRFHTLEKTGRALPIPFHMSIEKSEQETIEGQQREERDFMFMALDELGKACDFIVIDTPGTDSFLSRLAHSYADTLVSPMNDSFIDLDLLADIDPETHEVRKASIYTRMVREAKGIKRERTGDETADIDWIVMRNRLSALANKNKIEIYDLLQRVSEYCGFRQTQGFSERVIFRELFLKGLTLMDLEDDPDFTGLTPSHLAARQEVRSLINAIGPEKFKPRDKAEAA